MASAAVAPPLSGGRRAPTAGGNFAAQQQQELRQQQHTDRQRYGNGATQHESRTTAISGLAGQMEDESVMEPDIGDTRHMQFVDGRCGCCPYGYHVDVDFLHFLDSEATSLHDLKKIHRSKKNLRRSMEEYLHEKELGGSIGRGQNTTGGGDRILEEVDRREVTTELQYLQGGRRRGREDEEYGRREGGNQIERHPDYRSGSRYRTEAELMLSGGARGAEHDSCSSLSGISSGRSSPGYLSSSGMEVTGGLGRGRDSTKASDQERLEAMQQKEQYDREQQQRRQHEQQDREQQQREQQRLEQLKLEREKQERLLQQQQQQQKKKEQLEKQQQQEQRLLAELESEAQLQRGGKSRKSQRDQLDCQTVADDEVLTKKSGVQSMTSADLANRMESLLPPSSSAEGQGSRGGKKKGGGGGGRGLNDVDAGRGSGVDTDTEGGGGGGGGEMTRISAATLAAIREQMTASLQRMRELEEQNKAIPVLEVRVAVLKEEKRMLGLQLKSATTSGRPGGIDDPSSFDSSGGLGAGRSKPSRTIGVGDGDVFAQPDYSSAIALNGGVDAARLALIYGGKDGGMIGGVPVRIHEKELNTEQNTEIREKEVRTVFVGGREAPVPDVVAGDLSGSLRGKGPGVSPKPKITTRSIGVGSGNVFDTSSSNLQIHEKELRTVFIGGDSGTGRSTIGSEAKSTRNVGILCKAAMRDVGMMHMSENEKPMTRNIAVGAGEIGVVVEEFEEPRDDVGDGSNVNVSNSTSICQTNLAIYQSRSLGIKPDQIRSVIDELLRKTVHSVETQCRFSTDDKGTDAERVGYEVVEIGCSDDTTNVDVVPKRVMKSVACDYRPSLFHRACGTDIVYRIDQATNTFTQGLKSERATNTDKPLLYPASTNTEAPVQHTIGTKTESAVFHTLKALAHAATATEQGGMVTMGNNTDIVGDVYSVDARPAKCDATTTTAGVTQTMEKSVNTATRSTVEKGMVTSKMTQFDRAINTDKPRTAIASVNTDRIPPSLASVSGPSTPGGPLSTTSRPPASPLIPEKTPSSQFSGPPSDRRGLPPPIGLRDKSNSEPDKLTTVHQMLTAGPPGGEGSSPEGSDDWSYRGGGGRRSCPEDVADDEKSYGGSTLTDSSTDSINTQVSPGGRGPSTSSYPSSDGSVGSVARPRGGGGASNRPGVTSSTRTEVIRRVTEQHPEQVSPLRDEYLAPRGENLVTSRGAVTRTTVTRDNDGLREVVTTTEHHGSSPEDVWQTTEEEEGRWNSSRGDDSSSSGRVERRVGQEGATGGLKSIMKQQTGGGVAMGPGGGASVEGESRLVARKKVISFSDDVMDSYYLSASEGCGSEGSSRTSLNTPEDRGGSREGSAGPETEVDRGGRQGGGGGEMESLGEVEEFEMSADLNEACETYALWLDNSTQVNSKQLNSSLVVLQSEWFAVSSHKMSSSAQVEDFLACIRGISFQLVEHIVNMADENGNTTLHYAVSQCNMEIVSVLLSTGACDVNKQNRAGYTAIMLAALADIQTDRQLDVVRKLFEAGDVNIKALRAGQTALMLAVSHGRLDMVRMLLDSHADVNAQDDDGSTALMCASEHGYSEIVRLLLAHPDIDASIADNDGSTAMSIAMEAGHRDVGVQLYAHINFKPGSPVIVRRMKRRDFTSRSSSSSIK